MILPNNSKAFLHKIFKEWSVPPVCSFGFVSWLDRFVNSESQNTIITRTLQYCLSFVIFKSLKYVPKKTHFTLHSLTTDTWNKYYGILLFAKDVYYKIIQFSVFNHLNEPYKILSLGCCWLVHRTRLISWWNCFCLSRKWDANFSAAAFKRLPKRNILCKKITKKKQRLPK